MEIMTLLKNVNVEGILSLVSVTAIAYTSWALVRLTRQHRKMLNDMSPSTKSNKIDWKTEFTNWEEEKKAEKSKVSFSVMYTQEEMNRLQDHYRDNLALKGREIVAIRRAYRFVASRDKLRNHSPIDDEYKKLQEAFIIAQSDAALSFNDLFKTSDSTMSFEEALEQLIDEDT